MTNQTYDNPPSYDSVTETEGSDVANSYSKDVKKPAAPPMQQPPSLVPGPSSYSVHPGTTIGPSPTLYHYRHPVTQEMVVSLLPPDHPDMICLQTGEHDTQTHFGILGVLAAVFWFPLGIGLCLLDRRVKCKRCGQVLMDGACA